MEKTNNKVLGFLPLLAVVVGSVVGAGIFNSPADLGSKANPGAILISWLITGLGIFALVKIFQYLGNKRPELEGGIYSYAREAAGEFVGFNSAWGYWWSVLFGNLAYFFAIPKILSTYFPILAENKWAALILSSILLWSYFVLIISGIKTAGIANVLITILKLSPLVFVVFVTIFMFKPELVGNPFAQVIAGNPENSFSITEQIFNCFNVMLWTFLGIEGAVVMSNKAKNSKDVGKVTLIGFGITLTIYILVSTLSLGVAPAQEIVGASSPLGKVLGFAIGPLGEHFLNFGFLFSVMGALLSWMLLAAETPFICAFRDGSFPKVFAKENKNATPYVSLFVSAIITQTVLLLFYSFSTGANMGAEGNSPLLQNLYYAAISLAVICALVPYCLSCVLAIIESRKEKKIAPLVYALISILFFCAVFIAMWKYAVAAVIIYTLGACVRVLVHIQRKEEVPLQEIIVYSVLFLLSVGACFIIGTGQISF